MATYQNRENNGCTARIRLKGHNESKTFYPAGGKTAKQLAEKWARDEEDKILAGNYKSEKKARTTSLIQALDQYEIEFASKLKGYSTEKYRINAWRQWKYKETKLADLTDSMFIEYRDDRRKFVKDGSIRLDLAVITAIFSNTNYGIPNPAAETIATLAAAKKRDRRFRGQEQQYILDAVFDTKCSDPKRANKYLPLVVIFGIETACRMSEIVEDNREHTTGLLREFVLLDNDKSIARIFDTKNGADRYIPLTPAAIESVNRALNLNKAKTGPVFRTTVSAIKQAWGRAKARAKKQYLLDNKDNPARDESFLEDFHFHDLRHEAASRWKRYFDIHQLKDLTGHRDIRSLDRYLHSDEDDIKEMAQEMTQIQNQNKVAGDRRIVVFPSKKKGGK